MNANMTAKSKAEATARMYQLAGEPLEPLGPGSKEKRSAFEALGRALGLDLVDVRTKAECGRRIAKHLDVVWDLECYSAGDSITLVGMNRLLGEVEKRALQPRRVTKPTTPNEGNAAVPQDDVELERQIAEGIATLTQLSELPEPFSTAVTPVDQDLIQFADGSWRTHLASVVGWLHLNEDLDTSSDASFDTALARGLGFGEGWDVGAADALGELLLPRLADRLDRALALREDFLAAVEDAQEVGASVETARSAWVDAWEEAEDESDAEGGGPIHAEAATWPISEFVGYARDNDLNLSPSYQRADVWPTSSSQMLIESILRGIPLPSIIILERVDADEARTSYEVVDGKQRLTSILRFIGCHPRAVELVEAKAVEWGEPDLLEIFQKEYPTFKKLWKKHETTRLTAQVERLLYFPFPLRSGEVKPLSGELAALRGRYYCQIRDSKISVLGQPRTVKYVFEQTATYKLPVITYKEVSSEQIHEVFSLYNKQGKHLNAEEIRNALYHHLSLMKALVVTAGDSGTVDVDAPFLSGPWEDLSSTQVVLNRYGFGQAGYKRTKLLSWVSSVLLLEDGSPESRSTANHINALLKRVESNKKDLLRNETTVREAMVVLDKGLDAHAAIPPDVWAKKFVNSQSTGKWQELQLVSTLIGLCAAYVVHGDALVDVIDVKLGDIAAASASWTRPGKTQSKEQWLFIAGVVADLLELLDVPVDAADTLLRDAFGASGLKALVALHAK